MTAHDEPLAGLTTKGFILLFVGTLGLVFVAVLIFALISDGRILHIEAITSPTLYVLQNYIYAALIALGVYLFGIKAARLTWPALGFRRCSPDWIVRAFLLGVPLYGIRILVDALGIVVLGWHRLIEPTRTDLTIIGASSDMVTAALMIAILVLTPFATEIFQRGILFSWLRRNFNFMLSAIPSAIIFGALHIELVRYMQSIVFGVCAAYLYERARSLWPAIALHITINAAYVFGILYL